MNFVFRGLFASDAEIGPHLKQGRTIKINS